jgi:hypothetical protein
MVCRKRFFNLPWLGSKPVMFSFSYLTSHFTAKLQRLPLVVDLCSPVIAYHRLYF